MKKYAVQKQLIAVDGNIEDPNWLKRQVWVYKLNSDDTIDDFDTIGEAKSKRDELDRGDPSNRVYRVVKIIDKFTYEVIQ
jgi:hypothetical protein